ALRRTYAGNRQPAGSLVSDAERAPVHDPRFRRPLRTRPRRGRAGRRIQCLRYAAADQVVAVDAEPVRRKSRLSFAQLGPPGAGALAAASASRLARVGWLKYRGLSDFQTAADGRHHLFARLNHDDARNADRHTGAETFDRRNHAQQQPPVGWREVERLAPLDGGEHRIRQLRLELA